VQLILGNIIRIIAVLVLIGATLVLLIGGIFGIMEVRALDGPSQYGLIILIGKIGGSMLLLGIMLHLVGKWLIAKAPQLEAVSLPIDSLSNKIER
jgi:hypothetical protein